jgi:hypothetical protein
MISDRADPGSSASSIAVKGSVMSPESRFGAFGVTP